MADLLQIHMIQIVSKLSRTCFLTNKSSFQLVRLMNQSVNMSKAFVGQKAPDFSGIVVENGEFRELKPESYQKLKRFVILLFYPMDL